MGSILSPCCGLFSIYKPYTPFRVVSVWILVEVARSGRAVSEAHGGCESAETRCWGGRVCA